jgi:hypothetical protein
MDEHGARHLFYGEGGGMNRPHLIPAEKLRGFGLRGIDTHGIYLCDVYARRLQKGLINPTPNFRFKKKRSGIGVLDADFSLGQPATMEAAHRAVELAKDAGVGIVVVKNSNHFGTAAYYAEFCAKEDCIGLVSVAVFPLEPNPGFAWTWPPAKWLLARSAPPLKPEHRFHPLGLWTGMEGQLPMPPMPMQWYP